MLRRPGTKKSHGQSPKIEGKASNPRMCYIAGVNAPPSLKVPLFKCRNGEGSYRQITDWLVKAEDKLICSPGSRTRSGKHVLKLSDLPPLSSVAPH